ncbi:hypothetical protein B0H10DRAFT_2235488 [Mycena sp. CBHHK59/15]|nr:hypothetical protein B0H10DRAFT_2235488 [Mycena sp. CBHHK59/15]
MLHRHLIDSSPLIFHFTAVLQLSKSTILIILLCQSYYGCQFDILLLLHGCSTAVVVSGAATEAWMSWVGGTEFSQDVGDAAHTFSFKGADPHAALVSFAGTVSTASYAMLRAQHFADFAATFHGFSLGQTT